MKGSFEITSRLAAEHRPALEDLLFFNAQQDLVRHRIVETIERYGMPEIFEREGTLRVRLPGATDAQALFALAEQSDRAEGSPLAGMALFVREAEERFVIVHIGVTPAYSAGGPQAEGHLFLRLLQAIRAAARRTRGVRHVELLYGEGRIRRIPV
jgi:hypothetical protein